MTQTETKWAERVAEWKASGQTAKAFAHGRDFKPSTLTYWAYRLRRITGQPSTPTMSRDTASTGSIRMVRVRRRQAQGPSPTQTVARAGMSSTTMVIAVGAVRIEVQSGFDRALLTEIVQTLGGGR